MGPNERSRDEWTIEAMIYRGGSFVKALGEAAIRADGDNLQRIKATWPEYWAEYEKVGEEMERRDGQHPAGE